MRLRVILVALGALLVLLLVVAQLLLPGFAERRVRDDLSPYGVVERVSISAFPAVQLLWGRADDVTVRMRDYRSGRGRLADFLVRTDATDRLDVGVGSVRVGVLTIRDARLTKDGDRLAGSARVTDGDLARALPPELEVRPVGGDADALVLEGAAVALGVEVRARARLRARAGTVVVEPEGLLGGLASLTVFSDPRVDVLGVGGRRVADGAVVSASAELAP